MRIRTVSLALIALAVPLNAAGQPERPSVSPETEVIGWIFDHVSIRQSLKDKNLLNKPAFVQLSIPDEGAATRVVAAAATFDLRPRSEDPDFNVGLTAQFNENTSDTSPQNVFAGGIDTTWLRDLDAGPTPPFSRLTAAALFKRNGVTHTKGVSLKGYWSLERLQSKTDPYSGLPLGDYIEYLPLVGLEYDNALRSSDPAGKGAVTRGLLSLSANLYALPGVGTGRHLILSADLSYRGDIQTDFDGSDRHHPLSILGAAFSFDPEQRFLIAIERLDGENPDEGFAGHGLWRLALKVQLSSPQKRSLLVRRAAQRLQRLRGLGAPPPLRHPR
jgi:hypothetical protein